MLHVNPEILGPMGELALGAVGTAALLHEVLAERALGLRGPAAIARWGRAKGEAILP